jgi:drug/metabolite transporter (DMT)-like permease
MQRPSPAALGCVCGIALSWVASTQLSQTLVSAGGEASGANLFLVWVSTAFNVLLVPLFWSAQRGRLSLRAATSWGGSALPIRRVLRAAGLLYPLWLGANYLYVRALGLTSASTVTAVFSTTPAVVAVLSWVLLHEPFWPRKVGAVVLAIVGVLCVDLAPTLAVPAASAAPNGGDGDVVASAAAVGVGGDSTALAVSLTAVAALCAGSYKVLLRSLLGETTAPPIALYLSCLGAINIIAGAPIVLALHALGIEVRKRPFPSLGILKMNILPRHSRNKYRGNLTKRDRFFAASAVDGISALGFSGRECYAASAVQLSGQLWDYVYEPTLHIARCVNLPITQHAANSNKTVYFNTYSAWRMRTLHTAHCNHDASSDHHDQVQSWVSLST